MGADMKVVWVLVLRPNQTETGGRPGTVRGSIPDTDTKEVKGERETRDQSRTGVTCTVRPGTTHHCRVNRVTVRWGPDVVVDGPTY